MSEISRTALFGKLNSLAYKAIEGATVFCKMRGNPYVELEHWFAQLLQAQDSDLHRVIQHYGLDVSVIAKDMTAALDRLPRGATAISDFSPHIENAIERMRGSLLIGGALVIALLLVMLRDWRGALISFSAIPMALLAAVWLLTVFGFSLNTMTLGGLVVALGVVVDDADEGKRVCRHFKSCCFVRRRAG